MNSLIEWLEMTIPRPWGLSLWVTLLIAGVIHAAIGSAAAIVAIQRGGRWQWWVPMGLLLGTPGLVLALRLPRSNQS
jgi:hypothetical protein